MGGPDGLAAVRARYAREISGLAGISDPRIEAAFASVKRENYLNPPPWRIFSPGGLMEAETADPARLYADVLVVLDRRERINNGQPSLHASWMSAVDPRPGERVVQVGIGAGYYTAILAALVGGSGRVEAFEIEPRLAERARNNLRSLPQVAVHPVSGIGAALPRADVIYVSAGAAAPDAAWLRALAEGGRLVFPWQPQPHGGVTALLTRAGPGFRATLSSHVAFVGCVGASPRDMPGRGLPKRPFTETRAAYLAADRPPDASATAIYDEVWFSARDVENGREAVAEPGGSP